MKKTVKSWKKNEREMIQGSKHAHDKKILRINQVNTSDPRKSKGEKKKQRPKREHTGTVHHNSCSDCIECRDTAKGEKEQMD